MNINNPSEETSDILTNCIKESLSKFEITNKLVALCADTKNGNFGGSQSIMFYLKCNNQVGKHKLVSVNCVAHILNNYKVSKLMLFKFITIYVYV